MTHPSRGSVYNPQRSDHQRSYHQRSDHHMSSFHKYMTLLWALLLVPTLLWWRDSIVWVSVMSLYANFAGHWACYQASRAEEKVDDSKLEEAEQRAATTLPDDGGNGTDSSVLPGLDQTPRHVVVSDLQVTDVSGEAVEKARRVYYQGIVYSVCIMLDKSGLVKSPVVCGTLDNPSAELQVEVARLIGELARLRSGTLT